MRRILNPSSFIFYFCYPNSAAARSPIRHPFRSASSFFEDASKFDRLGTSDQPFSPKFDARATLTPVHEIRARFSPPH